MSMSEILDRLSKRKIIQNLMKISISFFFAEREDPSFRHPTKFFIVGSYVVMENGYVSFKLSNIYNVLHFNKNLYSALSV